jgi:hypothetical protein
MNIRLPRNTSVILYYYKIHLREICGSYSDCIFVTVCKQRKNATWKSV